MCLYHLLYGAATMAKYFKISAGKTLLSLPILLGMHFHFDCTHVTLVPADINYNLCIQPISLKCVNAFGSTKGRHIKILTFSFHAIKQLMITQHGLIHNVSGWG